MISRTECTVMYWMVVFGVWQQMGVACSVKRCCFYWHASKTKAPSQPNMDVPISFSTPTAPICSFFIGSASINWLYPKVRHRQRHTKWVTRSVHHLEKITGAIKCTDYTAPFDCRQGVFRIWSWRRHVENTSSEQWRSSVTLSFLLFSQLAVLSVMASWANVAS